MHNCVAFWSGSQLLVMALHVTLLSQRCLLAKTGLLCQQPAATMPRQTAQPPQAKLECVGKTHTARPTNTFGTESHKQHPQVSSQGVTISNDQQRKPATDQAHTVLSACRAANSAGLEPTLFACPSRSWCTVASITSSANPCSHLQLLTGHNA